MTGRDETRVVCVGNEFACDDGLGIRIGRVLQELSLPPGVAVHMAADVGLDLIDAVTSTRRMILVDATRSGRPAGTIQTMTEQDVAQLATHPCCCHALGLPELLRLAARLDATPRIRQTVLVGVEAETLERFGTTLSPAVQAALPEAVAMVLELVGAEPELINTGRARALEIARWEPAGLEAFGG